MKVPIFVQKIEKFTLLFIALCFTVSVSYLLISSFLNRETKAATCGGAVACDCGDTVTSDYTLTSDLSCSVGLRIGADNVTLNGNGHTINISGTRSGIGIADDGYNNVTIENLTIRGLTTEAIHAAGGLTNINIINNTVADSRYAIRLNNIDGMTISGNTISNADSESVEIVGVANVDFNNNTFLYTARPFAFASGTGWTVNNNHFLKIHSGIETWAGGTFTNNQIIDSTVSNMINWTEISRLRSLHDTIDFNFSMNNFKGVACPGCTYTLATSPTETVTDSQIGNAVSGSFTVNRKGTYTLKVTVTDPATGNYTEKNYLFLVDATGNQTTRYYFSNAVATHGQGAGGDAKALKLTAPVADTEWNCDQWIGNSIDDIPNYLMGVLDRVDYSVWYRDLPRPLPPEGTGGGAAGSGDPGVFGLQKIATYDPFYNLPAPGIYDVPFNRYTDPWIPTVPGTKLDKNFTGLNIPMDYPWSWYNIELKYVVETYNDGPTWQYFTASPSYADFKYDYTTTPAVKSLSNSEITVLSATQSDLADPESASIVLEGNGSTDLVLGSYQRPFNGYNSRINADGTTTLNLTGLSGVTTIDTPVKMDITPSSGYVDVNIDTWRIIGDYYKKWTENGVPGSLTANHQVSDLKPNTSYLIKVNGVNLTNVLSDGLGQLNFNYLGGYSTKTFEIVEGAIGSKHLGFSGTAEILINNNEPQTSSKNVTLTLNSSTAKEMLICNDAGFVGCDWEPYASQKEWVLTEGAGIKTVYAMFRDENNNQSKLVSDGTELVEVAAAPAQPIGAAPAQPSYCVPAESLSLPEDLKIGDLIKILNTKTVYIIGCDGLRHPFPNEPTYFTWYPSFANIKVIFLETLSKITLGSNVTARPGTLVKSYTMKTVYAVEPGAVLRPIESETVAAELYGDKWNKIITDIPDAFWSDYKIGDPVSESAHPTGTVIQYQNSTGRYYIENGKKRLITSEVFVHNLFQLRFVIENVSSKYDYLTAEDLPSQEIIGIMNL